MGETVMMERDERKLGWFIDEEESGGTVGGAVTGGLTPIVVHTLSKRGSSGMTKIVDPTREELVSYA